MKESIIILNNHYIFSVRICSLIGEKGLMEVGAVTSNNNSRKVHVERKGTMFMPVNTSMKNKRVTYNG